MKKYLLIAAALLPLCNLIAQTFLNQNFGTSKAQVQEFLKTRNLSRSSELDENTLVAAAESYTVTYYFEDAGLYKIETVRDFPSRKEANEAVETYKAQMVRLASDVLQLNNDKELFRFAALRDRELHEVSAFSLGKNGAQVRTITIDLDLTPGVAMEELRQDNMLFAMIH